MALEDYVREARALVKSLRAQADSIEKQVRELLRLEPIVPPGVLEDGQLLRRPAGWNVADGIEPLLKDGPMRRNDLIRILVDRKLVKVAAPSVMVAAARRAITLGELKGYLRIEGEMVRWVPGVYENPRVRKNT